MESTMQTTQHKELYQIHKEAVINQGRKLSWIAKQLDCSYSLIHKYLNGHKIMSQAKIEKIHKILFYN